MKKDTTITHAGLHPLDNHGVVNPPVYRASTVLFPDVETFSAPDKPLKGGTFYGRFGTPTQAALREALLALEGGHDCMLASSGLAAITAAVLSRVGAGDHVLMPDTVYGPTRGFCQRFLRRFQVETSYYDPTIGGEIAGLMRPETKVVFVEAPGSYTFEMQDIPAIAEVAHQGGAAVIMDNTWATPFFFRPLDYGVDISVQALTKYVVGHSDVMLGSAVANEEHWPDLWDIYWKLGYSVSPDDSYLALRGLRTLSVRLARHQETGLKLARWLAARPEVERVLHPGLPEDPGHAIWQRDFSGSSGLFGLVLKPVSSEAQAAMLDHMQHFGLGYSWGGYESLLVPTNIGKLRSATEWPAHGRTWRLHAGLEDPDDLIADLEAGFERLNATG
jgi:cystathionine beta-lyase